MELVSVMRRKMVYADRERSMPVLPGKTAAGAALCGEGVRAEPGGEVQLSTPVS